MCYRTYWPQFPAFALPSFCDRRIRINLEGRELHGVISASRYEEACRGVENLLRECRNQRTGEPAVNSVERSETRDPFTMTRSEADLVVVWRGDGLAVEHPRLGS